jgi:hypothetical protein
VFLFVNRCIGERVLMVSLVLFESRSTKGCTVDFSCIGQLGMLSGLQGYTLEELGGQIVVRGAPGV